MSKPIAFFLTVALFILFSSCKNDAKQNSSTSDVSVDSLMQLRFQYMLNYPVDSTDIPRSFTKETGTTRGVTSPDWVSGFFPGNLWQLYKLTANDAFKNKAKQWTAFLEKEKHNGGTHDMGFKIYCSFGEGFDVTGNAHYKDVIIESAKTLSTRFNENVGSLRSWDWNADTWEFPVIVDNMMNLELLFEASWLSGDSIYHKMAVTHANTTLKNHYRDNNSSYHVVVYDTISGAVKEKVTHQGYNDASSWARGQAWGIYGFAMTYRYTKDQRYLDRAVSAFDFYRSHEKLPEDGIPYWDFDAPDIPNEPRDVSAAAIIASACFEIDSYTDDPKFLNYAKKVLNSLRSKEYLLPPDNMAPFILDHSTGNWPKKDEMDEPIAYADYYFLEALLRSKKEE